jgi:ABC-type sugar transport system ATPase subunit
MTRPLLRMTGIAKRFPGVQALDGVALEVGEGEVHGLLGENGAGKSTLLKILAGAQTPDAGEIEFAGAPVTLPNPQVAQALGIVTIYQEFNLIPSMTVEENLFLGREPVIGPFVSWAEMRRGTLELAKQHGLDLPAATLVRDLSVAQQQMVEIARALSMRSRLIVMDEPTSALSEKETQRLFQIMRNLKQSGISTVFVTHRLPEVLQICDRITVLRDGRPSGQSEVAGLTIDGIIRMMVGRSAAELFKPLPPRNPGATLLEISGLSRRGAVTDPRAVVLQDVSLKLRRGEILGIAGLVGSGRTELARCLFGADPRTAGTVTLDGKPVSINSPRDAIAAGIGLVPEDRKQQALFLDLAVRENLSITALGKLLRLGFVRADAERAMMERYRAALNIRMAGGEQKVKNLSGGNQQKVVLARWLALEPRILIVDEPTRGIDVGAKAEVHQLLHDMAMQGIAIIAISSELPEVLAISDRIITMRSGHISGEVRRDEATERKLMSLMTMGEAQAA